MPSPRYSLRYQKWGKRKRLHISITEEDYNWLNSKADGQKCSMACVVSDALEVFRAIDAGVDDG